ncbi:MAG: MBL fold metallo-hydrolase [Clostridiales Family XIII bacterium]|jgi:glyoxylase-like metal-dependent hydrolase (beta-lactamase superfamily II)|nr:MBL fold metallo-hydrolase [Clostridiales Family XIII bacterium]
MDAKIKKYNIGEFKIIQVGAVFGGECFLIIGSKNTFLIDSGFAFCGERTAGNIRRELGDRPLDYILLTHSHFDHAGGSPVIAAAYPNVKIVCHERAVKVFKKQSALRFMQGMDDTAAEMNGWELRHDILNQLHVDIPVTDGFTLHTADTDVLVLDGQGHTRDSIGYFFKQIRLIVSNESACILIEGCGEKPIPEFIVSYQATLDTISRFEAQNADHLLISHHGVISGRAAEDFFRKARIACEDVAAIVMDAHAEGLSVEEIARKVAHKYHDQRAKAFQSDEAYLVNMRAMIPRLIEEQGGG